MNKIFTLFKNHKICVVKIIENNSYYYFKIIIDKFNN